jgi:ribosomal protein L24E
MKKETCEMCGADLKLQPGRKHVEDGRAFCNPTCAATYRVTQEPRTKELNGG